MSSRGVGEQHLLRQFLFAAGLALAAPVGSRIGLASLWCQTSLQQRPYKSYMLGWFEGPFLVPF